jgi:hypothetical protein
MGAFTAAPRTTGALLFAAKLKGLEGFVCTPFGKPLSVTWTGPVNPFCPFTDTLSAEFVVPCCRVMEFEEAVMEKSGTEGGGGGDPLDPPAPPPPQPAQTACSRTTNKNGVFRGRRAIKQPHVPFQRQREEPANQMDWQPGARRPERKTAFTLRLGL